MRAANHCIDRWAIPDIAAELYRPSSRLEQAWQVSLPASPPASPLADGRAARWTSGGAQSITMLGTARKLLTSSRRTTPSKKTAYQGRNGRRTAEEDVFHALALVAATEEELSGTSMPEVTAPRTQQGQKPAWGSRARQPLRQRVGINPISCLRSHGRARDQRPRWRCTACPNLKALPEARQS